MSDPVADMLTRIRNGLMRRKASVLIPASNLNEAVVRILVEQGYLTEYSRAAGDTPQDVLSVKLKYGERRERVITGIKRVSRPGRRVYTGKADVPRVRSGLGVAIISTSQGLKTDKECRRDGVGGEVLCYVW